METKNVNIKPEGRLYKYLEISKRRIAGEIVFDR